MPITQDRLISLIDAAEVLGGRLKSLAGHVQRQRGLLISGGDEPYLARNLLTDLHDQILSAATFPESVVATVSVEKAHFSRSRHKNEMAKKATRRWRDKKRNFAITESPIYDEEDLDLDISPSLPADKKLVRIDTDLIAAIDETFDEAPNGNSILTQDQLGEIIEEVLSISDLEQVTAITYKLIENKIINHAYQPGPQGLWIRGASLKGIAGPIPFQRGMWLGAEVSDS